MKQFVPFIFIFFYITLNLHAQSYDSVIFFQNIYEKSLPEYRIIKQKEFKQFCQHYNLNDKLPNNQKQFYQLNFYHDLFTGVSASNYIKGGILQIPYFWHWVNPNPRHEIKFLPKSNPLTSISPPKAFSKYKTFADIDRVPSLYLSDLLTVNPKYYHPECGKFYTFGWCSEREMAFNTLFTLMNYECKIKQEGIHTWSEIWLTFTSQSNHKINLISIIDNTFDTINWKKSLQKSKIKWKNDYGSGNQIRWYNNIAKSEKQKRKVGDIKVHNEVVKRIENNIKTWINHKGENG